MRLHLPRHRRASLFALAIATAVSARPVQYTFDSAGNLVASMPTTPSAPAIVAHPTSQPGVPGHSVGFVVVATGSAPLNFQWQFNNNDIPGATADTLFLTNLGLADFGAYRVVVGNSLGSVTSSNALLQLDSDRDGMADSWEITYFGSITNRSGFEDYDQDGVSDLDEFLEGTGPKNFSSVNPRLTIVSDRGEVFVPPNVPFFTNGHTLTLTTLPAPRHQFLS